MKQVIYEKKGHLGIITLYRPKALNALNSEVLRELAAVLEEIDLNEIRCLILTGSGERAFAAGADINEMSDFSQSEGEMFGRYGNDVLLKLECFPVPVIAAIRGFALGGGCELALSCDIRLCSEDSRFGLPEVGLGITPGFGGTQRLGRIIGQGRAKELIYTGSMIDAKEAWRIGLVNHIYPPEELMNEAVELAEKIARNAPVAVRNCKEAINQGCHLAMAEALRIEGALFGACFTTIDQKNGMQAFLDRSKEVKFLNR